MNNLLRNFNWRPLHGLIVQVLLTAVILLGNGGCHFSKPDLPGKWQETSREETIEFYSDGRFTVAGPGEPETGSWTRTEEGRVKLEISILGSVYLFDGELAGDLLRIKDPDGEIFEYYKLDELAKSRHPRASGYPAGRQLIENTGFPSSRE